MGNFMAKIKFVLDITLLLFMYYFKSNHLSIKFQITKQSFQFFLKKFGKFTIHL